MTEPSLPFPRAGSQPDALPRLLQQATFFLPWRAVPKRGGVRKVPLGFTTGSWRAVNAGDPAHHLTLEAALSVVHAGHATGIGVHIGRALRLVAVDLDHCISTEGRLNALALEILAAFPGTYAERSPSRRGLHLLVPGVCPPGWRRRPGLELVDAGYLTVTGDVLRMESDPRDRSADLAAWHARWASPQQSVPPLPVRTSAPGSCWSARARALFAELEAGGTAHYPSASEADLSYLLLLLRRDPGLSDAALLAHVRASGRMRPKWLQTAYLTATLNAARQIRARSTS
ncbi:hypothetical protein [Deinococcus ficus]|uniref:hypothetical protein n=1 Tax=Deinococcus ficus TaxID=317577 RepID=UPI0003F6FD5E|nr:hypothetical protein [Deinococcus ficus]